MKKKDLKYTFKMILKTALLALPLFAVAFSAFAPQREQTNVEINYKYQTNDVNSIDDLIDGNIYSYKFNNLGDYLSIIPCYDIYFDSLDYYESDYIGLLDSDFLFTDFIITTDDDLYSFHKYSVYGDYLVDVNYEIGQDTDFIYFVFNDNGDFINDNLSSYVVLLGFDDFYNFEYFDYSYNVSILDSIIQNGFITRCPQEYIPIENVDIVKTNPTMESQLIDFSNQFLDIPINNWYRDLVSAVGLSLPTNLMLVVFIYPLYILWVELFDIMLHCFLMLTELAHKFLGEKD